jgi:hypothetical protein
MTNLKLVTYCGLYCPLCAERGRIPQQAQALREAMQKEGWEFFGPEVLDDFAAFWRVLTSVADPEDGCSCRDGRGGPPSCAIRKCARAKHADVCPFCEDYPCEHIRTLAKGYPTLIADGLRMKELGIEGWVHEQEERAKTGFAYCDIRCEPYAVPGETS